MFRLRHEVSFAAPIATVYDSLLAVLARRRWQSDAGCESDPRPPIGQRYITRNGAVVRSGRVVECLYPVLLTLHETLFDPPCRVRLRLRWRLEPTDSMTAVRLDTGCELNRAASLNRKRWQGEIDALCRRLHVATAAVLDDALDQGIGVSGQRIGSSTMTVTNTTNVNGSPSFK